MKIRAFFFFAIIAFSLQVFSQEAAKKDTTYWLRGGLSSLTFSQVSLTNWAAGGNNSSAVNSFLFVFADKKKARHKWDNSLQLAYGLIKQNGNPTQKSDDKINLVTRYSYQVKNNNKKWFLTAFVDFRSQFAPGFAKDDRDSVISRFMAPGYLTVGSGIDYSPNQYLSIGYQPVTGKLTIVTDDELVGDDGAYGVRPGENIRHELGSYFRVFFKRDVMKNVKVDSRLELFTNYQKTTFGLIDVNWQNTIVMTVNKYLSTNLFTQILYDDDIKTETTNTSGDKVMSGAKTQFKNVFGVGLTYAFGAERPKK